jgi:hypothetical protein
MGGPAQTGKSKGKRKKEGKEEGKQQVCPVALLLIPLPRRNCMPELFLEARAAANARMASMPPWL